MLRLIWKSWWRHKERLILLVIGALIISAGLSYLIGLSETSKGTVVDTLRKNWEAQYHILVRPPGSRGSTESEDLLSPNYLSGLSGGISLTQWNEIKEMQDIDVAAPLAILGYTTYQVTHTTEELKEISSDYIYRKTRVVKEKNGYDPIVYPEDTLYYAQDSFFAEEAKDSAGELERAGKIGINGYVLLAGISPEAEAKLVGLDKAVIDEGMSRYFQPGDQASTRHQESITDEARPVPEQQHTQMPVLLNDSIYNRTLYNVTLERIKLSTKEKRELKQLTKREEIREYLNSLEAEKIGDYSYSSQQDYQTLLYGLAGKILNKEKGFSDTAEVRLNRTLNLRAGPVQYDAVEAPFPERWEFAFRVQPVQNSFSNQFQDVYEGSIDGYRKIHMINDWSEENYLDMKKFIQPNFIGVYDSSKLQTAKNPLTKLPMQTYRPPTAKLMVNKKGNPVNPPAKITPRGSPGGFLLEPPTMLTTIEAASQIMGDKPISSIRVTVKEVDQLTEDSQQKLEEVASEIEEKTGLITDITLGSSPQPTLLHVPSSGEIPELGWVQMPWIHLGASYTIYNETKVGFSGVIASVMLVALAYVLATNLVSFLARRKEFAVLLATGWRTSQLVRLLIMESLMVGAFVATVAWIIEGIYFYQNPESFSVFKLIIVGVLGLFIYLLGAIGPAILVSRLSPYETMKTGEIRRTARRVSRSSGLIGMSFNHLFGKFGRNTMSIFAMAFPTMLLAFFLFVSFRLQGVMYTTWLGQYAALQVGTSHYIAMGIALVIAVLTTAEIMWQNIVERKPEIALLKATGWRNKNIRLLVLLEGIWTGLAAGILGMALAVTLIWIMYQQFPVNELWLLAASGVIPLLVGILGSILPSEIAVRVLPNRGLKEG
ncbi:ABC transporter permease [Virgibacillus kekensis]|uniref:ABC transporter permease n=1 Tax=Virgibacillus kekensis TaxID=202261 RepID=A0ABV9DLE2_9BACI